jgi:hypothetical protein
MAELNGRHRDPSGRSKTGQFLPGRQGGPGRPIGSRNRLSEKFLSDLQKVWLKKGAKALDKVADENPEILVRVVASILPKQLDAMINMDVNLFAKARTRLEAYRLARDYIGAENSEPMLIEAQAIEVEDDGQSPA